MDGIKSIHLIRHRAPCPSRMDIILNRQTLWTNKILNVKTVFIKEEIRWIHKRTERKGRQGPVSPRHVG